MRDQAAALAREQLETAAVMARDSIDDCEAQPGSALAAARFFQARERLLQPLCLLLRDARWPDRQDRKPLPDAFGHCNVAAPSFIGNKFTNRPWNSVKCRNSGVPIVRFFFEIPLGLIGTSAIQTPCRVSSAMDTISTA